MTFKYLILTVFLLAFSCNRNSQTNLELSEWKSVKFQPIDQLELGSTSEDIASLTTIVGGAQVVCLGESRHDISEQFKLKSRFMKYLIQELGFRVFALEASLPYSVRLNDYLKTGSGSLDQIMAGMPGWFLWDTLELKELLAWIREYNAQSDDQVSFYGFDIVAPNNGFEQIFNYLESVDVASHNQLGNKDFGRDVINDDYWPSTLEQFEALSDERKETIKQNVRALHDEIERNEEKYTMQSSEEQYQWVLKLAYSAREAIEMFSANDRIQMGLTRDSAMANICSWIIEREQKTIIWAHNVHIAKSEFTMSMFPEQGIKGMGALLAEEFEDRMISIGGTFGTGEFQNEDRSFPVPDATTLDGAMAVFGVDNLLIDLRQAMSESMLETWLERDKAIKGQDFEMICVPIDAFDALYYTNRISKVKYSESTLGRMGN